MIQHNKPSVGDEEVKAIKNVIQSGWLARGEITKKFEDKFSRYLGIAEGGSVALSSGTSALYLALLTLGVKPNDEIILPTYTCSAILNAIFMAQATPILVDINASDFNISPEQVRSSITPKTKAIIVPHTFGVPADIISLKNLGIPIIEDCATSIGSKIGSKKTGTIGDISIFSFHATKFITTGQGGMLSSNNKTITGRARDYLEYDLQKKYYPRFNFQITDLQSAMGVEQMKKIKSFLLKRRIMAKKYIAICKSMGWDFQKTAGLNYEANWYRFVLKLLPGQVAPLKKHLYQKGVSTIIPIEQWELLNEYLKMRSKRFPVASRICKETLSLPIYPKLLENNAFDKIIEALKSY